MNVYKHAKVFRQRIIADDAMAKLATVHGIVVGEAKCKSQSVGTHFVTYIAIKRSIIPADVNISDFMEKHFNAGVICWGGEYLIYEVDDYVFTKTYLRSSHLQSVYEKAIEVFKNF
ncbi:hypothetical protein A2V49_01585 [candidate division WWE3 bacterium RBG_19FT_COMBO_34_6]|uniref:Uncharacterized protein n=1 Tax=candidate division WWE3 bacterium RBG_19FT_COMBO_34_6 TaxID=1802612 RepID=A0A1F4UK83_UNCKA|nr:MAG: hypothetical protein A2V49_01585 [candidate division WWE3 bacterium RBG_19FT_COMBO_34_6]